MDNLKRKIVCVCVDLGNKYIKKKGGGRGERMGEVGFSCEGMNCWFVSEGLEYFLRVPPPFSFLFFFFPQGGVDLYFPAITEPREREKNRKKNSSQEGRKQDRDKPRLLFSPPPSSYPTSYSRPTSPHHQ